MPPTLFRFRWYRSRACGCASARPAGESPSTGTLGWAEAAGPTARTAPQDRREPVRELGVAGRAELRLDEVVLAERVAEKHLLALVRRRHQTRDDETGEEDAADGDLPGHARREPEVVDAEEHEFLLVLALPRGLGAVESPEPEHDGQERVTVDVLVLPHRAVWAAGLAGGPQEEEGLHHHIVVQVLLVGERVVHGVLLRPPLNGVTV